MFVCASGRNFFQQIVDLEKRKTTVNMAQQSYPSFGNSTSPYDHVQKFYSFWNAFTTERVRTPSQCSLMLTAKFAFQNFQEKAKWNTKTAENRWMRRRMDEENRSISNEQME